MLSFQTFIQQSLRTDMRRIVHKENTAILRRAVTYSEPKSKASFNFAGQYSSAVESGWQAGPVSQEMGKQTAFFSSKHANLLTLVVVIRGA